MAGELEAYHAKIAQEKVAAHQNGDISSFQVAGNIPAVPAGPGGDRPGDPDKFKPKG